MRTLLMHSEARHSRVQVGQFALLIGSIPAVLFFGISTALLPAWLLVALLALPVFLVLTIKFPELGLLFILLLMTGLVPTHYMPRLRLLGGQVDPSDLFLAILLPVCLLKGGKAIFSAYAGRWGLWLLTLTLGVAALLSTAMAVGYFGTSPKAALAEARTLGYWLLLPIAFACMGNERQRRRLFLGIVCIGLAVAAGQIVQALLEIPVFEGSRLEVAETLGRTFSGAVRSVAPGIMILMFSLLVAAVMFVSGSRRKLIWLVAFGILALGLIFTYGRTLWLIAVLGLALCGLSLGFRRLAALSGGVVLAGALVLVLLAAFRPVVVEALADRVTSYQREVQTGGSFNWRRIENRYALAALERNPWIGVAMGGDYKPYLTPDLLPEQTRHIHSGYLYMALKLGLPATVVALGALLWMALRALLHSKRYSRWGLSNAMRIAAPVFILLPFASAFTRPEWMTPATIGMTAVALAIAVGRQGETEFAAQEDARLGAQPS